MDDNSLGGLCIVQTLKGNTLPCVVAQALVEPHEEKIPICCFLNPKYEPTEIPENTVVVIIEEADPLPTQV